MSWRFKEPCQEDFDSEEEYEHALEAYEDALDDYTDACQEEHYERKYGC